MYATDSILKFAFPLGQLCGIRIRVSFLIPVVMVAVMWRLNNVPFGLISGCILLLSLLVHELAHLLVARATGGDGDDILLWPLGGLSEYRAGALFRDQAQMLMAGPMANLVLAACCVYPLHASGQLSDVVNPLNGFAMMPGISVEWAVWRMLFYANWILFLVNLVPVLPMDSGQLLRSYLSDRFAEVEARDLVIRLGLVLSLFGLLIGFVFDVSTVVTLSAFILILHLHESFRWQELPTSDMPYDPYENSDEYDEMEEDPGFMQSGDDSDEDDAITRANMLERWRANQEELRLRRESEAQRQEEEKVDEILQKLHRYGRKSLSPSELRLLKLASDRYRNRSQHS